MISSRFLRAFVTDLFSRYRMIRICRLRTSYARDWSAMRYGDIEFSFILKPLHACKSRLARASKRGKERGRDPPPKAGTPRDATLDHQTQKQGLRPSSQWFEKALALAS